MVDLSDLFWQASLEDFKRGYVYRSETDEFVCIFCGQSFENGIIYPEGNKFYEAKKYIKVHIGLAHSSPFHFLLGLDKKLTGLTDHQKNLLELFYDGCSDNDVAKALGGGSTSTIRNHRFTLRERQKQAKVFLALMELLNEQVPKKQAFVDMPRSSRIMDDRFAITQEENGKILSAYFTQGLNGPLASFPLKEKKRVAILRQLISQFSASKTYTEKEVTALLKPIYPDYALIRRLLIEYGFLDRTQDGSAYWVKL
ncbi:MAG: hypothetical protein H6Q75_1459 [Firmicutes bacterium]|nr:hypothetical protein [Bacillota bacterium]